MSKNINVKLTFSADTKAAQQQINQLQQTLSNIAATPISGSGLKTTAQEIQVATNKALELKVALNNATNVNTGKLNFNKFSQELKRNKTTLQEYAMQLQKLGPQGVQAFSQMATAIRQSETPLVAMQGKLAALGQTFMNTVKWSISSSMIQGVTRAFSSTIDYAKELNESLNNIRIVTGKSVADVSKFAQEANKAAKALSATTDEYAKASLIYFQQGLNDSAVAERTETTLKLAKVVGESAETTSEWMTAIWNNFDDGSRSLENYADVLAKLGAATASSADEIAGGLEKFAAVAETVGLSYEYAASALATITAETRQSEDVVGTALKTIFARVENLKLGDTLEDGTTLGQYSEALAKVGVNIKDSNGQLKEMDDILSGIGTTWQILDRDQQVALAQQVAGIRQYSQFMALMDNWDVMEENVEMAKEANGALEEQHEIWETGIEGATSRVKEELNEIKNNLLGENDLLPLLNIAEGFLDFIGDLIDSLGGLPGLLSIVASVGLKLWGPQAAAGLQSMVNGVKSLYGVASGKTQEEKTQMTTEGANLAADMAANTGSGQAGMVKSSVLKDEAELTNLIEANMKNISKENLEQIELKRQLLKLQEDYVEKLAQEHDQHQGEADKSRRKLETMDVDNDDVNRLAVAAENTGSLNARATNLENMVLVPGNADSALAIREEAAQLEASVTKSADAGGVDPEQLEAVAEARKEVNKATNHYTKGLDKLNEEEAKLADMSKKLTKEEQKTNKAFQDQKKKVSDAKTNLSKYGNEVKTAQGNMSKAVKGVNQYGKVLDELKDKYNEAGDELENFGDNTREAAGKNIELQQGQKDLGDAFEDTKKKVEDAATAGQGWTTSFINGMQGVASAAAGLQMLHGAFDSLSTAIADGTAGFSDYLSFVTSVGFALPMLIDGLSKTVKFLKLDVLWTNISAKAKKLLAEEDTKTAMIMIGNKAKQIAMTIKDIFMNLGSWISKGPVGWVIAGISAAALAAIGISAAVNAKKTAAQEEETDNKAIETAEGALEVAEGWKEESQAMDDLIDKHNKLKAANDQTIEGQKALKEAQQAIIDQIPQLIEKYKELDKEYQNLDLSGDIALLEGAAANNDVEQIEQITDQIDAKIADETSKIAVEGQRGAMRRTAAAMSEIQGDYDGKAYTVHVGGGGSYVEGLIKNSSIGASNGNDITLDMTDSKSFLKDYEELQKIAKKAEETKHTGDDAYREIIEVLDASEEQYNKLKELAEEGKAYEIQNRVNQMPNIDLSQVDTYEKYSKVVNELTTDTELLKIATEEEIKTWVEGQKVLSEYATLEKRAAAYGAKYGETYANSIKEYASELSEEDLKAFLKIDFDKFQVKEQWDELKEYIKHLDKGDELQKDVTAIASAEKNLKSNGTVEDYKKLQESLSWGQDGLIKYSEFLNASYGQQKAYLEEIKIKKSEAAQAEYEASLKQLKITREQYYLQLKEAQLKGDTFLQGQIEADLYNLEKLIEETETNIELSKLAARQAKESRAQRIRDFENSKKAYEDEYDAYRHINEISEDLQKTLDKIASAKEAAYGSDYIALLNQEIRGLEVENDLLEKTIELANKRAAAHKNELAAQYGAQFDSFGNISNYNEIQGKKLQSLAEIEGSKGKDSEAYKNAKQDYDDFVKLAEDYNEDLEKSEEATQEKADNMREILDKKLEGIEYEINIKIEVDDHYLNILERQLKRLDDDAYDGAERIINYGAQASKIYDKQQLNASGIQRVLGESGVSEADIEQYMQGNGDVVAKYNLSANAVEALEEYTNGFIESQEQFEELAETVKQEVMTTFNTWRENIDEVGTSIAAQKELIQNYRNIVDIVGKDKLGINDATLKALEKANNAAAQASLNNTRAQKEATASALENAKANKAMYEVGTEEYEYWVEIEKELNKQFEEDTANFMSSWEDALTTAYETFTSETERAIEELSDFMAGINFDSMSDLAKSFEWQQEVSDRYLEGYEKAYELSKLNRKIQKDIDATDSVKAQKMMRDMQKEIADKQAAGVEMSQHDLEILQKKYDLRLAEIAMEEARNAKSVVRLTRDSEGNFGYTYTADQSSIDNAEQSYEDKLYNMQKSNDDYIENLSQKIISNRQAMEEEIAAIDVTSYASKEEYLNAVQEITEHYTQQENYLLGEIQKTIQSNSEIYNEDILAYGSFVGHRGEIDQTWITTFAQTPIAMATGFKTIQDAQTNLNTAIGDPTEGTGLLGTLSTAYDNLASNVDSAMGIAGTSVTDFGTTVNEALYGGSGQNGIINDIEDLDQKTIDYEATAKQKFGEVSTQVVKWYKEYGAKLQAGKKDTDALEGSIAKLKSKEITIDTKVNGKDQVEALTKAIEGVKTAIEKLQNTEFKITANISTSISGSGNNGGTDPGRDKYTYHVGTASEKASKEGFMRLEDSSGNYVGYAHESTVTTNTAGDMANLDSSNQFYKYLVYDGNGDKLLGGIQGLSETSDSKGFPIGSTNFLSFDGNYSQAWKDDGKLLKEALQERAGRIYIGDTPYFGFKRNGETYFADLNAIYETAGVGENPAIRQNVKYYKAISFTPFDTGGYTGDWGPDGRLAMLHQKEIVLNAHDTENFLAAIGIVRDISDQIEKNAIVMQYQNQLANYRASVGNSGETLQQEVHITAEFPNATNHNEIEEAFRNLTNLASQYANRK